MASKRIIHTVVFSLHHPPESQKAAAFLAEGRRALAPIPGVNDFQVREQINGMSAYQFGFSMVFEDQEAYSIYSSHPAHSEFVETHWKKEVSTFLELDFVEITE
jgi:hypothetical protein